MQGWTIKKMYSSEKSTARDQPQESSPVADEYAPVIFAQDTYKHVVSLDMLSGDVCSFNLFVNLFIYLFIFCILVIKMCSAGKSTKMLRKKYTFMI